MKSSSLVLACTLTVVMSLLSPGSVLAEQDDLWGLFQKAQSRDPSVGRALARVDASKADVDVAFSQFMPRLSASAGVSWISSETLYHDVLRTNLSEDYRGHNYGFQARVPVFMLSNFFNMDAARAGARGADAMLEGSRQDLAVRVTDAYFDLLKARTDVALYKGELQRLEQILAQAQAFLKAGTGDVIAVYEAKARMNSAATDLVKAESQQRIAEHNLSTVVGRTVTEIRDLGPAISPRDAEPNDMQWWLETMAKNHSQIVQAREALTQSQEQRNVARSQHLPTLSAQGGYDVSKGSTFLPAVETRQWSIGLRLVVPIYEGGETSARIRKALATEAEQRFILYDRIEQQTLKLKQAFLELQLNVSLVNSLREKKASNELQLQAVRKGRAIGTRSAVDLMDALQSFAVSQRDLSAALYNNAVRHVHLKSAAGILTEADLLEVNAKLTPSAETEAAPPAPPATETASPR